MSTPGLQLNAFTDFYRHVVPRESVAERLAPALADAAISEQIESLIDSVWHDCQRTVEIQSFRTLIGQFHVLRNNLGHPLDAGSDTAIRAFRDRLTRPGVVASILREHPVLDRRLQTIVANMVSASVEMVEAFTADLAILSAVGFIDGPQDRITALHMTTGDTHNDNRKVTGLGVASGARIVFKPRTLRTDQLTAALFEAVDPVLEHSLEQCLPPSADVGSRGWQRLVTPGPMDDAEAPQRYFYRFGALCALLGAIGASDLHEENVIAVGEHPCIVDTETILRPNPGVSNDSLAHTLINQLKLSVASTMLVPMSNPASQIDLIMSGLGVEGAQASAMTRAVVTSPDTDGVRVDFEPVTYHHGDNVPRLGDDALSPIAHMPCIVDGAVAAQQAIRSGSVTAVLARHGDITVRCLLRSTMVYSRFLDAATHPDYLITQAEADRVLGLLGTFPEYFTPAAVALVAGAERDSLTTGNVPYFQSRAGSRELATVTHAVPDVHRSSPIEFATLGLKMSADRGDLFQRHLLEECLGDIADDDPADPSAVSMFAEVVAGGTGQRWRSIARIFASLAVSHHGPQGVEDGWVCGIGPDRDAPTVTPGNFLSFHDNGGIVRFLDDAARSDVHLTDAAERAARGLTALAAEYDQQLLDMPEGVFTGAASMLAIQPPTGGEDDWLRQIFDRVTRRIDEQTVEMDLGNGVAGLAMIIADRIEAGTSTTADSQRLEMLASVLDTLGPIAEVDRPWFDTAHGELGRAWATCRIGRVLGDCGRLEAVSKWLVSALETGPYPTVPGWCTGTAGILLATAEILISAGETDQLMHRWLPDLVAGSTTISGSGPIDLSVCHGAAGVSQVLLAVGRRTGQTSLTERAVDHLEQAFTAAGRQGFSTGSPGRTSLLGYMLGWSGVGHTDLLVHRGPESSTPIHVPLELSRLPVRPQPPIRQETST